MIQMIEDYDGLPGYHVVTDTGMRRIRSGLDVIDRALTSEVGVKRVHLPDIVPPQVLDDARQWLSPQAQIATITTAFSDKVCGALPVAGLCLQSLPHLYGRQWSHRDLPTGVYTVGPASPPVPAGRAEDVVCANGVLLTETESAAIEALDEVVRKLFPCAEPTSRHWGLRTTARVWEDPDGVLSTAQCLDQSVLPQRAQIRYIAADSAHRTAAVTFFYFSEHALMKIGKN